MAITSKVTWMMPDATHFSTRVSGNSKSFRCFTARSSKSLSVRVTIFSNIATINSLNALERHMVMTKGLRIRSIGLA